MTYNPISVSQLNKYIKDKFEEDEYFANVLVEGEISNFKNHYTGHMYFTLKDDKSLIKAIMFKTYTGHLDFVPQDGMKVMILGSVSVFERDGTYQLYAKAMKQLGKMGDLRAAYEELKEKLEKEKKKWENKNSKSVTTLTEDDIAEVISSWTNIPVKKITQDENEKLKNLEQTLHERVIGQDEAVSAVAKAIRRGRLGLKDPNRPIGSFLFLGQTGVGKTELSKALAECLFGNEDAMIRIDMSEYMESHSVAKLIGAPPGYVGFDEAGQLTEKVRRKPYSVILFDEIEKAHPDVMNMLLQILDDGRLTDSQGRSVNFKNTVIIMTSNVGARLLSDKKSLGFSANTDKKQEENKEYEDTKKEVMSELKKQFRPEFINRIDEIIVFHKLGQNEITQIIDIMLKRVQKRLQDQNYKIEIDQTAKDLIAKNGVDDNYGARPLRRAIQNLIEDKIAEAILDGKIKPNKPAKVTAQDDKIQIS